MAMSRRFTGSGMRSTSSNMLPPHPCCLANPGKGKAEGLVLPHEGVLASNVGLRVLDPVVSHGSHGGPVNQAWLSSAASPARPRLVHLADRATGHCLLDTAAMAGHLRAREAARFPRGATGPA